MMTPESFSLTAIDGMKLNGYEWDCPNPKAVICLVHGLGEHQGRYAHFATFLNENNIALHTTDLRGHGISEGKRGHTPSFEHLLKDVEELLMHTRSEFNNTPIFLMGHSLGGNIVANYVLKENVNELAGAIISSPWLKLTEEPSSFQKNLAAWVSKLLPSLTQPNGLNSNDLTHDMAVNQAYQDDPLNHNKISTKLFVESYDQGLWAIENSHLNKLPLYLYHGAEDKITAPFGSKEYADNAGKDVSYKLWEGVKHEPHNDVKKEEVMQSVLDWALSKI
jgi:alpha-beta hydrolase superfamily lysophospholipase